MSVLAYHPETGADLVVDEDQMVHMRASGWLLRSEWDENQAQQAAAQEKAAKAKTAKTADEGK